MPPKDDKATVRGVERTRPNGPPSQVQKIAATMQLVVNTLYAVPVTLGLMILGILNAILWGLLTLIRTSTTGLAFCLLLAEENRQRGVMLESHRTRFADSAKALVANLEEIAEEEGSEEDDDPELGKADEESEPGKDEPRSAQPDLPDRDGR